MLLSSLKSKFPPKVYDLLLSRGFSELRPSQYKAVEKGLFDGNNLLVCTPTGSGKTLVAELAILNHYFGGAGSICVYVVPLRALASEKYKEFSKRYPFLKVALTSGDFDSADNYLAGYDLIITTSEKFDSLIRHRSSWIPKISLVVVDEVHLLNDPGRGPTLEVLITILRKKIPGLQLIALSATVGNSLELASWLDAELVVDSWRPVRLDKGFYLVPSKKIFFK